MNETIPVGKILLTACLTGYSKILDNTAVTVSEDAMNQGHFGPGQIYRIVNTKINNFANKLSKFTNETVSCTPLTQVKDELGVIPSDVLGCVTQQFDSQYQVVYEYSHNRHETHSSVQRIYSPRDQYFDQKRRQRFPNWTGSWLLCL